MSITAEKVAEMLALPVDDRAYLAHKLIDSLDDAIDADAQTEWDHVVDLRNREVEQGKAECRPV